MEKNSKILITGAAGMLGSNLRETLNLFGYNDILCPKQEELDLLNFEKVETYIRENKPEYIFHLAGLVYGLGGNLNNQLSAIYNNSIINLNLFYSLKDFKPRKIFFAGTVASYPYPYQSLPLKEEQMFYGKPHYGEYGYAASKNLGYQFLELLKQELGIDYCVGLFTNLFGEHDTFDSKNSHVVPSLISKVYKAKKENTDFEIWGNGAATRDFLYAKDAARAAILSMNNYSGLINISSGNEVSLKQLADLLIEVSGFEGKIVYQADAPIGIERRFVDNTKLINLGFKDFSNLKQALELTYQWYKKNKEEAV